MIEMNEKTLTWDKIEKELTEYWKYGKLKKFIKAVTENDDTFSWTEGEYIDKNEHLPDSSKYCIPCQVIGCPQKAVIFLCLFNPSISDIPKESGKNKIRFYLENVEDAVEGKDWQEKIDKYHLNSEEVIVNTKKTVLEIETEKDIKYYTSHYFNGIKKSVNLFSQTDRNYLSENLASLPVCDLELVPYRAKKREYLQIKNS